MAPKTSRSGSPAKGAGGKGDKTGRDKTPDPAAKGKDSASKPKTARSASAGKDRPSKSADKGKKNSKKKEAADAKVAAAELAEAEAAEDEPAGSKKRRRPDPGSLKPLTSGARISVQSSTRRLVWRGPRLQHCTPAPTAPAASAASAAAWLL